MKKKKIAVIAVLILGLTGLWGCGEGNSTTVDSKKSLEEQVTESKENEIPEQSSSETEKTASDTRFRINQTAEYDVDNGGRISVTMTGWGSINEIGSDNPALYIAYTIENIGEEKVTVGNSLFTVYADNYAVDPFVVAKDDKIVASATLSGGRKVDGELYAAVNPYEASVIEVELWDSVFVIKDIENGINEPDMSNNSLGSSGSGGVESGGNADFDAEWYKKTPNFAYDDGTTLEIVWDDYNNLTFVVSDGTVYYGENYNYEVGNIDGAPTSYAYNVTDAETGEDDVITYYPPNGLEVPLIGSFTAAE